MVYGIAQWLQSTRLSVTIQSVDWIIPTVQSIHIVTIALVFGSLLTALSVPVDAERLAQAVAWSSFSQLKQQEDATGFREGAFGASTFFRQGEAGSWRSILTREHVAKIVTVSNETMARFGYLKDVTIDPRGDARYA